MEKFQSPEFVCIDGYEVNPNSMSRAIPQEIRQKARFYIAGLKKLWQESKQKRSFEKMGEQVHGNTNTQQTKYAKLVRATNCNDLVSIGQGASFSVESYVDGSYTVTVN